MKKTKNTKRKSLAIRLVKLGGRYGVIGTKLMMGKRVSVADVNYLDVKDRRIITGKRQPHFVSGGSCSGK